MDRPRVITCILTSADGRLTIAPDVTLLYGDEHLAWLRQSNIPYIVPATVPSTCARRCDDAP